MRSVEKTISAVIPSLGRSSLANSIASVMAQTVPVAEIIIVDDSKTQRIGTFGDSRIKVIKTGGERGASFSRNLGMQKASSSLIAFLDDDDCWLRNHIEVIKRVMEEKNLDACFSSAIVNGKQRPKVPLSGTEDPLVEIYSERKFWRSNFYIPTPSLVIKKEVSKHIAFNECLENREDLWFTHKIYEFGFKLLQCGEITVKVQTSNLRNLFRSRNKSDLKWALRLRTINTQSSRNFILNVALRNALLKGDLIGVVRCFLAISN